MICNCSQLHWQSNLSNARERAHTHTHTDILQLLHPNNTPLHSPGEAFQCFHPEARGRLQRWDTQNSDPCWCSYVLPVPSRLPSRAIVSVCFWTEIKWVGGAQRCRRSPEGSSSLLSNMFWMRAADDMLKLRSGAATVLEHLWDILSLWPIHFRAVLVFGECNMLADSDRKLWPCLGGLLAQYW